MLATLGRRGQIELGRTRSHDNRDRGQHVYGNGSGAVIWLTTRRQVIARNRVH